KSVWWQWTAPESGSVEVNTIGSTFDTVLGVYTGGSVDQLSPVAENDDAVGSQSQAFFNAVAGTTYHIAVSGFAGSIVGDEGDIVLRVGMTPENDNFDNATEVTGGTVTGHNLASTGETGEPGGLVSGQANTVWWKWTATAGGSTEINTFGSDFDTRLAVYRDATPDTPPSLNDLELVVFNDDAGDSLQSQVLFDATVGETYYIAVDGFLSETGAITLTVPDAPTSGNNPPVIADQQFSVDENSTGGAVVGTVTASDPDGQPLAYSITGGSGAGLFTINQTTGQIQVLNSNTLNYEAQASYTLTVQVTDNGSPNLSHSATVTINLNDVNEAPTLTLAPTAAVAESSAAGTLVATASGADVDAGDTLSYSIVSGNTGGAFAINAAGQITVLNAAALDYETTPTFELVIRVTDSGGLVDEETITVNLSDVDDNSPEYFLSVLSTVVNTLLSQGDLTQSQANTLLSKLADVAKKLAQDNTTAALNNLNAFVNQVNSLVNKGALTSAEAAFLFDAVDDLEDAITG
ncbi:MAG TPA: cadherin repeat domain-containing protein, partial [Gemmata sp.]|nr:cadherin repeat domain-containing protein [Gemmata sp.]